MQQYDPKVKSTKNPDSMLDNCKKSHNNYPKEVHRVGNHCMIFFFKMESVQNVQETVMAILIDGEWSITLVNTIQQHTVVENAKGAPIASTTRPIPAPAANPMNNCYNELADENCNTLASIGECENYSDFMHKYY